ncbi:MAG: metallophosphatase family protein [Acidobacteria bacterium]|nr:metallophosphatase family protein [Acidobacteriota bacterium]MCA1639022.1 metallophosphatase family protein [Acidobacteriota bacterium]
MSDTHNLLRPEAVEALKNVDLIIHAGDICNLKILEELRMLAPVVVVRGNNDKGPWVNEIPIYKVVEIDGIFIYVIHDIKEMNVYPAPLGINVVISGHSHKPLIKEHNDILYLNPGSAGPRRFNLPVSIAKLKVNGKDVKTEITQIIV